MTVTSQSEQTHAQASRVRVKPSAESLTTRYDFDQPGVIFTSFSIIVSVVIFILSVVDHARITMYLSPIVAGLTLVFHFTYFVLRHNHRRRHRRGIEPRPPRTCPPSYWRRTIFCVYALMLLWIAPLVFNALFIARTPTLRYDSQREYGLLIAQTASCGLEIIFLMFLVVIISRGRRQYFRSQPTNAPPQPREKPQSLV